MKPYSYIQLALGESIHEANYLREHGFTQDAPSRFLDEVDEMIDSIRRNPTMFKEYSLRNGQIVRVSHPTSTFSFKVAYIDRPEEVVIIALIHPSRKPNYWLRRKLRAASGRSDKMGRLQIGW